MGRSQGTHFHPLRNIFIITPSASVVLAFIKHFDAHQWFLALLTLGPSGDLSRNTNVRAPPPCDSWGRKESDMTERLI